MHLSNFLLPGKTRCSLLWPQGSCKNIKWFVILSNTLEYKHHIYIQLCQHFRGSAAFCYKSFIHTIMFLQCCSTKCATALQTDSFDVLYIYTHAVKWITDISLSIMAPEWSQWIYSNRWLHPNPTPRYHPRWSVVWVKSMVEISYCITVSLLCALHFDWVMPYPVKVQPTRNYTNDMKRGTFEKISDKQNIEENKLLCYRLMIFP